MSAAQEARDDERLARWAARLSEPPDFDIDAWTLLWEARIVEGPY